MKKRIIMGLRYVKAGLLLVLGVQSGAKVAEKLSLDAEHFGKAETALFTKRSKITVLKDGSINIEIFDDNKNYNSFNVSDIFLLDILNEGAKVFPTVGSPISLRSPST